MAKNFRRMFAMVMVLCMILSALPMQALAEETTHDGLTITITPSEGSGSSGGESGGSGSSGSDDSSGSGSSGSDESSGSGSGESSSSPAPTSKVEVSGTSTSTGATVNMNGTQTETSSSTNSTSTDNSTTTTTTSESNIVLSGTATESDGTQKQISYEGTNTETETEEVTKDESTGNTTTNTTTDVTWKGTEQDGDITKAVSGKETTEESSTTNAKGEEIASSFEVNGSEKKEWTEDIEVGQDVPTVKVEVLPGESTNGEAHEKVEKETDNLEADGGSTEEQFDWTTVTTITDREVTVKAGEIEIESTAGDLELKPVAPDTIVNDGTVPGCAVGSVVQGYYADGTRKEGIALRENYFDRFGFDVKEATDPETGEVIYELYDSNGNKIEFEGNWNGDYQYCGYGDYSPGYEAKYTEYYNSTDKDGNPIIKSYTSWAEPIQFALQDKEGNIVYAYCVDLETGIRSGAFYDVDNLEAGTYYADPESESHIRAIVKNGYWGSSNEKDAETNTYKTGSLAKIKDDLAKAFADPESGLTDKDVTVMVDGVKTPIKLSKLMEDLTEAEALCVTQAAIWSWSNGAKSVNEGSVGSQIYGVGGWSAPGNYDRMDALYTYLMSLTEEAQTESTVIDETSFLEDGSMNLVIGEKLADGAEEVEGETVEKDVYNVGLNFKLAFAVSEKDELFVYLVDSENKPIEDKDGNKIIKHLLPAGSDAKEGSILPGADGSYTLTGLRLAENSDFTFDLKLEGTQYLEQGVYVYSPVGGRDYSQTVIGMAEGTREVSVSTSLTVSFSVDESSHVVAERVWHHEKDPVVKPTDGGKDPTPTVSRRDGGEPAPRPQIFRLNNNNLVEIPEEPVPLATPARTGDSTGLWVALFLTVAFAMVAVNLFDKKRQHEAF